MSASTPTLFRPEVLTEQKSQWLGPVLLVPKMSHRLFAGFGAATIAAVILLLAFGSYPRKVRVTGLVVPEAGLMQVYARQPGVITDVNVVEGAEVKRGDRLAVLSSETTSTTGGATGEQIARQLAARKATLIEDRRNVERLAEQQKRSLEERMSSIEASEVALHSQVALQGARVRSANKSVARQKALQKESIASGENVQTAEESQIEQAAKLREVERNKLLSERDKISLQSEIDGLPLRLQRDLAAVDQSIALVDEEIATVAAKRELVITAPGDGVVTALQAKRGSQPDLKTPLLAVVPQGSPLEAQIFCASRAIGFLKVGQKVLLRYEAFPYQKFGHFEGHVTNISRSAVNPAEMPPQLSALAQTSGTGEAVYRVDVKLAAQSVRAYGKDEPLQPGMQLEADVVLENRRLIEWMLEPLFTISGTWKR